MTVAFKTGHVVVHLGDALAVLRSMPSDSVDCIVSSPPYFALRDYGVAGQLGLEPTPQAWCAALVDVFREARRVLRPTGTAWINVGDSYVASPKGPGGDDKSTLTPSGVRYQRSATPGPGRTGGNAKRGQDRSDLGATANRRGRLGTIKPKDLIGAPWMLALALRDDGWYLRQEIIWHKPDAFPESVRDRPTRAHEQVFLLSKSRTYYYDADAISEPVSESTHARVSQNVAAQVGSWRANGGSKTNGPMKAVVKAPKMTVPGQGIRNNESFSNALSMPVTRRNARTVWSIQTAGYAEAHFAVFAPDLPRRCILAGCPPDGTVLDPFAGSGTTLAVARELGRSAVGIELNPEYVPLIERRVAAAEMARSRGDVGALVALPVSDMGPLWSSSERERERERGAGEVGSSSS